MSTLLTPQSILGIERTPLGLGTARIGAFWQGRSLEEGQKAIETSLDLGVTMIDTADVYARGIAERLVGRAVRRRDDVTVMTKVGLLKTPTGLLRSARSEGRLASLQGLAPARSAGRDYSSRYVVSAAEACLRRQGRDRLDALLLHEIDADSLRRGEFLDGMGRLLEAGKIRAWGASVASAEAAEAAVEAPGLTWLQLPVNVQIGGPSASLVATAREKGINLIGLAALGDGQLLPKFSGIGAPASDVVASLVERAAAFDGVSGVLLGMSSPKHAYSNLAAIQRGASAELDAQIQSVIDSWKGARS